MDRCERSRWCRAKGREELRGWADTGPFMCPLGTVFEGEEESRVLARWFRVIGEEVVAEIGAVRCWRRCGTGVVRILVGRGAVRGYCVPVGGFWFKEEEDEDDD